MWSAVEREIDLLAESSTHPNLKNCEIPKSIAFTKDLKTACTDMDIILFAVASPYVRATAHSAGEYIAHGQIIVDVAKGIEALQAWATLLLLQQAVTAVTTVQDF